MNSPLLHTLTIALGARSYPISIGSDLLASPATFAGLPAASTALIVSNTTVAPLYAASLYTALQPHYRDVHTLSLPDGEATRPGRRSTRFLTACSPTAATARRCFLRWAAAWWAI